MAFLFGIIFGVLPVSLLIVFRIHKTCFQVSRLLNMCKLQNLVFIQQEKAKYESYTAAIKENAVRLFAFQFNIYSKDNDILNAEKTKDLQMKLLKNQRLSHKVQLPNQPSFHLFHMFLVGGIYIILLIYLITVLFY